MRASKESLRDYFDRDMLMRYLGVRNINKLKSTENFHEITKEVEAIIEESIELSNPVYAMGVFLIDKTYEEGLVSVENGKLKLYSKDVKRLLVGADKLYVVGVGIGYQLERRIQLYMQNDIAKGVIMDACASVIVEGYCDFINDKLISDNSPESFTNRFSPGYGDLGLSAIKSLADAISLTKITGISIQDNFMMIPRKSVLFIAGSGEGIVENATDICNSKCKSCNLKNCQYKAGEKDELKE